MNTTSKTRIIAASAAAVIAAAATAVSCGTGKKVETLNRVQPQASLSMSNDYESDLPELHVDKARRDTFTVKGPDGAQMFIMNAVKDVDGEMVANEVLDAAVVTARFRNVAERRGKVDLKFDITVPRSMYDSKWQLRFYPDMKIFEEITRLEPVIITGKDYRKAQLKGYQQYERWLSTIITDDNEFINTVQLERWLSRFIPRLYALKNSDEYVSDETFQSIYGTTEREAVKHYTDHAAIRRNDRKKLRKDDMFRKWVKSPIVTEGIRLDTVIVDITGDYVYQYTQTINTRPKLRKVDIFLSGDIWEEDRAVYRIPKSEPLTFYISSVSAFTDNTERYRTRVIERRASANSVCWISFAVGKADVDESFGKNGTEIGRIKSNLRDLMGNEVFDLDSILVTASASPEGSVAANDKLSLKRAESVSGYFRDYMKHYGDSLDREEGVRYEVDDDGNERRVARKGGRRTIPFISRTNGENWKMLDVLVGEDTLVSPADLDLYRGYASVNNLDERERRMETTMASYRHLRETVYPKLRTVRFDFHLHRKGMIKDTVHTTTLDSTYMAGVAALRDMDYEEAVRILAPYQDYNTAVAYVALDRNTSAKMILSGMKESANRDYLLAIIYSREGDDKAAVQSYMDAVRHDPSFKFRGNLDPEISVLIKKYALNKE